MEATLTIVIVISVVLAVVLAFWSLLGRSKWPEDEWGAMKARDQWMEWLQRHEQTLEEPKWRSTAFPSSWTESEKRFADGDR